MIGTWLNATRRQRELAELDDVGTVDLIVVGGGVVGAGVALDAVTRGLSVVLLESKDLAAGTSGMSSKLMHGGLRYLARGEIGLAYESARERALALSHIAPHLIQPLPFLTPYGPGFTVHGAALPLAGLWAADLMRRVAGSRRAQLPPPRRVTPAEARLLVPRLTSYGLQGAVETWDAQLVDDARLVLGLARTAASYGARILTRCTVEKVVDRVAVVRDELSGQRLDIRGRAVVNATGVWASRLEPAVRLRPSRGVHLVVSSEALGHPRAALTVPVPGQPHRFVFALPQDDGTVYIGVTDTPVPHSGDIAELQPAVSPAEQRFLVEVLGQCLEEPITPDAILGSFAGLRPLLEHGVGLTSDLSRRHEIIDDGNGLITVVGGKLTTYRRMSAQAVDHAVSRYRLPAAPSRTARLPLVGSAPPARLATLRAPRRLVRRYGAEAVSLLQLAEAEPHLLRPVAEGVPALGVEFVFGALAEGALDVEDLLARRTRLTLVPAWAEAARPAAEEAMSRSRRLDPQGRLDL